MSNREKSIKRIIELIDLFEREVKKRNLLNLLDINIVSEDFLVEVYREVYDYPDLVNLSAVLRAQVLLVANHLASNGRNSRQSCRLY